jgi:hypothetical protein
MAKNCPTWQPNQGTNQQLCSQGQQNFTYGKVNHVTATEAQQSQDVVLGMFLANSHTAIVLFDSRASHSFISSKFVAKHNLSITIMKYTIIIAIRGVDFLLNQIIRLQGHIYNSWHELVEEV